MSVKPVLFTIRATVERRFIVESEVMPKGRLTLDYMTIQLALDYPRWYAQDAGVTALIEVRDPDGALLETYEIKRSQKWTSFTGRNAI